MRMFEIQSVSFAYSGREAILENFSLSVEKGECVLLCGESGCGKTTVTRLIKGLIPHFTPDCHQEGDVIVGGMDTAKSELYQLAHVVGSVFQNPKSQFFNLDTDSELAFGLENRGEAPETIRKRLDAATGALHIERLLHRNIFSLSGGQKQRLAIAVAALSRRPVLIFDEPTGGLDYRSMCRVSALIRKLAEDGRTVIVVSHDDEFMRLTCDCEICLAKGENPYGRT